MIITNKMMINKKNMNVLFVNFAKENLRWIEFKSMKKFVK